MFKQRQRHKPRLREFWVSINTLGLIQNGTKSLLVRPGDRFSMRVSVGNIIRICAHTTKKKGAKCERKIVAIRFYDRMTDVIDHEDLARMAHGNEVQTLSYLARIYRMEQEEGNAVVYELAPIEEEPS